MKKYYGKHTIAEFKQTDQEHCTICKALHNFLNRPEDGYYLITNLAKGNLKRHLASGKHWKEVSQMDRKTGKIYWRSKEEQREEDEDVSND